jgi:mono/diheme cytochrome c family protein
MKQLIALSFLLAFAPLSLSADPEAGKAMAAAVCAACHGAAGVSVDDAFPHLAGSAPPTWKRSSRPSRRARARTRS